MQYPYGPHKWHEDGIRHQLNGPVVLFSDAYVSQWMDQLNNTKLIISKNAGSMVNFLE